MWQESPPGGVEGASIEMCEESAEDRMFIFGCLEMEVLGIKERDKSGHYTIDPCMERVFDSIKNDTLWLGDERSRKQFCGFVGKLGNITAAGAWDADHHQGRSGQAYSRGIQGRLRCRERGYCLRGGLCGQGKVLRPLDCLPGDQGASDADVW
mmetsp:Transcript_42694/g.123518  ORF Transcript_42694/g.123518 Transcript_42694/m.123518 type:complete len:153 (+) Transcript_42694:93-551(+)